MLRRLTYIQTLSKSQVCLRSSSEMCILRRPDHWKSWGVLLKTGVYILPKICEVCCKKSNIPHEGTYIGVLCSSLCLKGLHNNGKSTKNGQIWSWMPRSQDNQFTPKSFFLCQEADKIFLQEKISWKMLKIHWVMAKKTSKNANFHYTLYRD